MVDEWNQRIRLTEDGGRDRLWERHVIPSLDLLRFVPANARTIADLGSGQGFPGLVLAIATGLPATLVDADRRKAAFLRHAAMVLKLPVTVHCDRIERLPPLNADFLTARAVTDVMTLVGWGTRHVSHQGVCAFPKGPMSCAPVAPPLHWRVAPSTTGSILLGEPNPPT